MKKRILIIAVLSLITIPAVMSAEFNGKVWLKINGHGYLLDDVFGAYLIQEWDANRESISAAFPLPDSWEFHLGQIKKLKYKTVNGDPDYLTVVSEGGKQEKFPSHPPLPGSFDPGNLEG